MKPAMLLGKQNTLKICQVGVRNILLALVMLMVSNLALASDNDKKSLEQNVRAYLDEVGKLGKYGRIKRYEEKNLKARMTFANLDEKMAKDLLAHFSKNLEKYRQLTGLKITEVPFYKQEKNVFFQITMTPFPISKITVIKGFNWYFNSGVNGVLYTGKKLEDELDKQSQGVNVSKIVYRTNGSINMFWEIYNVAHPEIKSKGISWLKASLNRAFFKGFSGIYGSIGQSVSITNAPYKYKDLQPLDKAYIRALYSKYIHVGMSWEKAYPILRKQMIEYLIKVNKEG